jgi:hypothetical protein
MSKAFGITSAAIFAITIVLFALALSSPSGSRSDAFFASVVAASDSVDVSVAPHYVGSKKCRMCHLDIYRSWQSTTHSRAMSVLTETQKAESNCARCHSTGTKKDGELIDNVGCEVCHGPGSEYRKMRVMKDRALAIQMGLAIPVQSDCVHCHNDECPAFVAFDYEISVKAGTHVMPSAKQTAR